MGFFTDAFENMNPEQKESFYKTVFMQDDSDYAAELRVAYYRTKLRSAVNQLKALWHETEE